MKKAKVQRTACQTYSRVVGYLSPVSLWNKGKKSELCDRTYFKMAK